MRGRSDEKKGPGSGGHFALYSSSKRALVVNMRDLQIPTGCNRWRKRSLGVNPRRKQTYI